MTLQLNSDLIITTSSFLQAFSNIVLVFLTGYFAFLTRKTVKEMSDQKDSSIMPVVIAKKFSFSEDQETEEAYCVDCKLSNIGSGPALNISIHFYDSETQTLINEYTHELDYLLAGKNEIQHLHIIKEEFDNKVRYYKSGSTEHLNSRLIVKIAFKNINGKLYKVKQRFGVEKEGKNYTLQPVLGTMKFDSSSKK